MLCDRIAQEIISEIRCISTEGGCICLLIYCLMEGIYHYLRQRLGHIADSETDDLLVRICLLICSDLLRDSGKKIAAW